MTVTPTPDDWKWGVICVFGCGHVLTTAAMREEDGTWRPLLIKGDIVDAANSVATESRSCPVTLDTAAEALEVAEDYVDVQGHPDW